MPKPNLYQSLHTSIIANGKIYEIQIRTEEMDDIAEYGVAAHWAYKGQDGLPINETISNKLKWYSDLIQFTEEGQAGDVVDLLKEDIFHSNVYVFTPDGDIIDLPLGSMPLDFAFRIHTEVGLKSVGAIVNNKIVPLEYKLQTGDIIKMKTSKQSFGPNDNWLKLVKTSNARSKIKNYLNKQRRDELVEMGRSELIKELTRRHHEETFTDKEVKALFEHKGVLSLEDLYYEIGKNTIKVNNAANALVGEETYSEKDLVDQINKAGAVLKKTATDFIVEGLDNPSIKLANCCSPLPGDGIVGYVSKGIGIAVHRAQCNNVKNFDEERLISVTWGRTKETVYNVNLRLTVGNRDNVLADVINATTASKGKVNQVLASTNARGEAIIKLKVCIKDLTELETVIQNLNKIKDVFSIERPMR
jgi:GTP pyrophosphokinase